MNIIKSKTARGMCPLLPPQRGDVPPFANPPVHFMAESWLVACQITQHCRLNNLPANTNRNKFDTRINYQTVASIQVYYVAL